MIDEKKLLDWLTRQVTDPTRPLSRRNEYRRLLSRIENGEFEQGDTLRQPTWMDDDDQW